MKKNLYWLIPVLICLVASIATLFLPVLTYVLPNGIAVSFNIITVVRSTELLTEVLEDYTGPFKMNIDEVWAVVFAVLAAAAIIAAFVGVITMSMQRPNTWQFVLALVGIIGTAIPSVLIFLAVILSMKYFPGTFQFGVYPIITPITMILCMITVTKRHRRTQAERRALEQAKHRIRPGGDL